MSNKILKSHTAFGDLKIVTRSKNWNIKMLNIFSIVELRLSMNETSTVTFSG